MSSLRAEQISVTIDQYRLLDAVSVALHSGEIIGLIGPNGAGKTTLLRVLAKLLTPDSGAVALDDISLRQISPERFARRCAYLSQGAPTHWPLRVDKVVALGRLPYLGWRQQLCAEDIGAIETALALAEVAHLRERLVTTLSGGERMRVLLARIFASQPHFILADEPVAALDPYHQLHVMELLREHAHRDTDDRTRGGVLTVLHDLNLAARFCDRIILLAHGRIVCEGDPRAVLTSPILQQIYGISVRSIEEANEFSVIPWRRTHG
jgi:iron complex transport system ATP-binding protein